MEKGKIFVALDVETKQEALDIVEELKGLGAGFKIGKQLFTATGPKLVEQIVNMGESVFLDLKYHDIPNTVAKAGIEAAKLGVDIFNVHASGGRTMMLKVREELDKLKNPPLVLAVTVLTSLSNEDLQEVGFSFSAEKQVERLAKLAFECKMDGVVASPKEIELIRNTTSENFKILTPGIRPAFSSTDDQKRIATPNDAIKRGADFLVIGRPIRNAKNRRNAFLKIMEEIKNG